VVTFQLPTRKVTIRETSKAWVSQEACNFHPNELADRAWDALVEASGSCMARHRSCAIMLSGGWDSRTLLAAAAAHVLEGKLLAYSHGDVAGRELQIARRVARSVPVSFRAEPIDDSAFDPDQLKTGFARTENVVFPHWHRSGRLLAASGVQCIAAGIFGEVLGGHYGPTMLVEGRARALAVARSLLGLPGGNLDKKYSTQDVVGLFCVRTAAKPWHLSQDFWDSIREPAAALNADIEGDIARLTTRGVTAPAKLIEAFIAEHRGAQYISSQLLSCRAHVDIAMPFADQNLLLLASQIPAEMKIQNSLNLRMMKRHAGGLLKHPFAATLVPGWSPIPLQEMSRLLRRILGDAHWKLHFATRGSVGPPRSSWINYEFLRTGESLRRISEDLQTPIWDRRAIKARIEDVAQGRGNEPLYPLAIVMAMIYTFDLTLR
jgi:hypothetical protein